MDRTRLLDALPLWGVFLGTIVLVALSVEVGYRLGRFRRSRSDQEKDAPVGAIVASTLGLLAFILAFTFGMAATRFEARRMVVLDEANAVGTTYLRAGLLPEPQATALRRLLREYVDVRLSAVDAGTLDAAMRRSAELHRELWAQTTPVARQDPHSVITGVFVQSLNEVIDLHSKRALFGLHNRIPELVWLVLYLITAVSMLALGYQEGLSGSRRSLAVMALAIVFSAVMYLIADLDRPQEGLIRTSQYTMAELRDSLKATDLKATNAVERSSIPQTP